MPLPQSVLERMQTEPSKTPGWSRQLLMFSGTIFFITVLIYVGLAYGYKSYLNSSVQKLQDQIQSFSQQIPLDEQTKIINFYSQLANLKTLLTNHVVASPVFEWLEKNTQANVFYSKFSLNAATNQLSLTGSAKTADDFNQQMAIFENNQEVKKMKTGGASFVNNLWQFDVTLTFVPGYFNGSNGPQ
jgi:hypothetical protein